LLTNFRKNLCNYRFVNRLNEMTPKEPFMRKGINLHMTILRNVKYDFELAVFNENYKNISMKIAANASIVHVLPDAFGIKVVTFKDLSKYKLSIYLKIYFQATNRDIR